MLDRVSRIIEAGTNSAKTNEGRSRIDCIRLCTEGYAEPGYDDPKSGVIAFGNWNDVSRWSDQEKKFVTTDPTPGRVAELLSNLGVELEWEDEWVFCDGCGRAVRSSPNNYRWQRNYSMDDDGCVTCGNCIRENPADYLESLEGKADTCVTIDLDPEEHGYVLLEAGFEHGFYGDQDADPKLIAEALQEQDISRFIFTLDSTGQFDMSFSVWVHGDESDKIDHRQWRQARKNGPSVVEGMKRALQDASTKMDALPDIAGHPKVAKCDSTTGTARVRTVTPQEFVEGKALDF